MGKLRHQELKGQVIWNQWQSSDLNPDNLSLKSMLLATILRCAASRDDKSWCKTLWSGARHRVDRTIIRFRGRKFNSSDHPQKREAPICGECSDLDLIPRRLMSLPLNFQGLLAEAFLIVGIPLEHASVGTHHLPSLHLPGAEAGMRNGGVATSTGVLFPALPWPPAQHKLLYWSCSLSCWQ